MKKLNQLQHLVPEGLLAPTSWFESLGYSRALLSTYIKSGWLVSPARGVYCRPGAPLSWRNIATSLNDVWDIPIHVGGYSALEHHGFGHYVRYSSIPKVDFYCRTRPPLWLKNIEVDAVLRVRLATLFHDDETNSVSAANDLQSVTAPAEFDYAQWGPWKWTIRYSSAERAMMEMLADVPNEESIYMADAIMQGLVQLRPIVVGSLMARCRSIKVKRLFLALATRHDLPWLRHIEIDGVDLGSGKRVLVPGGRLHRKFQITLPSDLDEFLR